MLFYSFFKTLIGQTVVVELKNDLIIEGTLHSVDQYLNLKITDISVTARNKDSSASENNAAYLTAVKNCFIRGSVVRYVDVPSASVNKELLQDACRKEIEFSSKQKQSQ